MRASGELLFMVSVQYKVEYEDEKKHRYEVRGFHVREIVLRRRS